jgi:hypothetical protein
MDTKLPQVLRDHVLPLISHPQIMFWIRSTVSPMVYALRFALSAKNERRGTKPSNIMWSEQSVTPPLEDLSMAFEILHKIHLLITSSPTFIIAVCPKLILNSLIRMRH